MNTQDERIPILAVSVTLLIFLWLVQTGRWQHFAAIIKAPPGYYGGSTGGDNSLLFANTLAGSGSGSGGSSTSNNISQDATLGAAAGSVVPGVGNVVGGAIGALLGGLGL